MELASTVISSDSRQASRSTLTSLTSGRALHCCKKNAFNSMCLVFRVEPLPCIIPSATEESHHRICCVVAIVSSASPPNVCNEFHCCRKPIPSQAPHNAATNSASPLLSAIVDCFLLDAGIGYRPRSQDTFRNVVRERTVLDLARRRVMVRKREDYLNERSELRHCNHRY